MTCEKKQENPEFKGNAENNVKLQKVSSGANIIHGQLLT